MASDDPKTALSTVNPAIDPAVAALAELRDHSGARGDGELVDLWLRNRASKSVHTAAAYRADAGAFFDFLGARGLTLRTLKLSALQDFTDAIEGSPATRRRRISVVRSLLSFGARTGYLMMNVGAAIEPPKLPNELAQRVLSQEEVIRMLNTATPERDRVILRVLYLSGIRVSEAVALQWRHVVPKGTGELVLTVHGKGGATRFVHLKGVVVGQLESMREGASDAAPVFVSRLGKALTPQSIRNVVAKAAKAAGIDRTVTPHFFRHSHVSHALDRGAPVHLVQQTVGHSSRATTSAYSHASPDESSGSYLAA